MQILFVYVYICHPSYCSSLLFVYLDFKTPVLKIEVPGPKVTSAVWGPLDEMIITGHENGELVQWDPKVLLRQPDIQCIQLIITIYRQMDGQTDR